MPIYRFEAGDPSCAQVIYAESSEELSQEELDARWAQLLAHAAMRLYKTHEVHIGPYDAALELLKPACARIWAQLGLRILPPHGRSRAYGLGRFDDPRNECDEITKRVGAFVRDELEKLNIRFVLTIDSETEQYRTLLETGQGRFTYKTYEEAYEKRRELFKNSEGRLREIYGDRTDGIDIQPTMCWPGHNDPQVTIFPLFDEEMDETDDDA